MPSDVFLLLAIGLKDLQSLRLSDFRTFQLSSYIYPMRTSTSYGLSFVFSGMLLMAVASCAVKRGCPAVQSSMGAERVLSDEKVKKQKFKIKGMN